MERPLSNVRGIAVYEAAGARGAKVVVPPPQEAEVVVACNILNRITELGRPVSFAIGP